MEASESPRERERAAVVCWTLELDCSGELDMPPTDHVPDTMQSPQFFSGFDIIILFLACMEDRL